MIKAIIFLVLLFQFEINFKYVEAHGRMMNPPQRGSMWRFGYDVPKDYNDMSGWCGGIHHLWEVNLGKCGVCGDPWEQEPRDHEPGGKFATGIIVGTYKEGDSINVTIELVANHYGYFEVRLCQNDEPMKKVEQECFDQNLLFIHNNNFENNPLIPDEEAKLLDHKLVDYKYFLPNKKTGIFNVTAQLPNGVTCKHCVLQWKYHAGNNFGLTKIDQGCLGCTNRQEEFYNCADIEILNNDDYSEYLEKKKNDELIKLKVNNLNRMPTTKNCYNSIFKQEKANFHILNDSPDHNLLHKVLDYANFIIENSYINMTNITKRVTFGSVFIEHRPSNYEFIEFDVVLTLLSKIMNLFN